MGRPRSISLRSPMLEELLAARLPAVATFALTVAVGVAQILAPLLSFVNGTSPRSPVLDTAVAVVLVTLPVIYTMGVILMYLHLNPPRAQLGALRRFEDLACTLAFLLLAALVALLFLAVADDLLSPAGSGGLTPT